MFGIGFFELVVIAVVALVFVGPRRLPDLMKQAGRLFVTMRRTANDVRDSFERVVHEAETEIRREEAAAKRALLSGVDLGDGRTTPASVPDGAKPLGAATAPPVPAET